MAETSSERWYAAHYDVHGELILSAPLAGPAAVGALMDRNPGRYGERLAVVERANVRTLAFGKRSPNGVYIFKMGRRLP
jgi:hypothetical protein